MPFGTEDGAASVNDVLPFPLLSLTRFVVSKKVRNSLRLHSRVKAHRRSFK